MSLKVTSARVRRRLQLTALGLALASLAGPPAWALGTQPAASVPGAPPALNPPPTPAVGATPGVPPTVTVGLWLTTASPAASAAPTRSDGPPLSAVATPAQDGEAPGATLWRWWPLEVGPGMPTATGVDPRASLTRHGYTEVRLEAAGVLTGTLGQPLRWQVNRRPAVSTATAPAWPALEEAALTVELWPRALGADGRLLLELSLAALEAGQTSYYRHTLRLEPGQPTPVAVLADGAGRPRHQLLVGASTQVETVPAPALLVAQLEGWGEVLSDISDSSGRRAGTPSAGEPGRREHAQDRLQLSLEAWRHSGYWATEMAVRGHLGRGQGEWSALWADRHQPPLYTGTYWLPVAPGLRLTARVESSRLSGDAGLLALGWSDQTEPWPGITLRARYLPLAWRVVGPRWQRQASLWSVGLLWESHGWQADVAVSRAGQGLQGAGQLRRQLGDGWWLTAGLTFPLGVSQGAGSWPQPWRLGLLWAP